MLTATMSHVVARGSNGSMEKILQTMTFRRPDEYELLRARGVPVGC
jgi:hypothetical protein